MPGAEADALCSAQRHERSPEQTDYRVGSYERKLHTKAGEVTLKMPTLRRQPFETAIIERYRRRETSIEEALIEMYLAGVSVRRVEDITEALWGTRVSSGTVSRLNQKVYQHIEAWRNRRIEGKHPYLYLDGVVLKRNWAGEVRNVCVLIAVGVGADGYRTILGVAEGHEEDKSGWSGFRRHLKERGLQGVQPVISHAGLGLKKSVGDYFPEAHWQRCVVHFLRNLFTHVPTCKIKEVARMLKAIHAQESLATAQAKAADVIGTLQAMKLGKAAELVDQSIEETLTYYGFPHNHWARIREVRRTTCVLGASRYGQSALMLCAAHSDTIAGTNWGTGRYLNMEPLFKQTLTTATA